MRTTIRIILILSALVVAFRSFQNVTHTLKRTFSRRGHPIQTAILASNSSAEDVQAKAEVEERPAPETTAFNEEKKVIVKNADAKEAVAKTPPTTNGWTHPSTISYWDQIPWQNETIQFLQKFDLDYAALSQSGDYIGRNDDGLDQYEFDGDNGSHVSTWAKPNGDVSIAEIKLPDGAHVLRIYDSDPPEIAYFNSDGSFKRLFFSPSGRVSSIFVGDDKDETVFNYDDSGRIEDYYRNTH